MSGCSTRTEGLIRYIHIPEIDAEVGCGDVRLLVRVHRDGVDVICMGVGVNLARYGRDDVVLLGHAR